MPAPPVRWWWCRLVIAADSGEPAAQPSREKDTWTRFDFARKGAGRPHVDSVRVCSLARRVCARVGRVGGVLLALASEALFSSARHSNTRQRSSRTTRHKPTHAQAQDLNRCFTDAAVTLEGWHGASQAGAFKFD